MSIVSQEIMTIQTYKTLMLCNMQRAVAAAVHAHES